MGEEAAPEKQKEQKPEPKKKAKKKSTPKPTATPTPEPKKKKKDKQAAPSCSGDEVVAHKIEGGSKWGAFCLESQYLDNAKAEGVSEGGCRGGWKYMKTETVTKHTAVGEMNIETWFYSK